MRTPEEGIRILKKKIKPEWKTAFWTAFILGLLIHLPVMLSDIPNHDGLSSMYFDQNMITSGRWFLMVACGFSSYYTLPWVIGLLGLVFLSLACAAMTEILELRTKTAVMLVSGLVVSFPALASTFAYVFTLDGYMLALLLAVCAVLFTKKYRYGFVGGAICLAFSMGTYQAYLSVTMLLCIYCIVLALAEENSLKEKIKMSLNYLYMGVGGAALYYVILQILLKLQGKELAGYQGINGMEAGALGGNGILSRLSAMYRDFMVFSTKGEVLLHGALSFAAFLLLAAVALYVLFSLCLQKKWWKKLTFFVIIVMLGISLPLAANITLFISPDVTYHLLMRYQWVLFLVFMVAFADKYHSTVHSQQAKNMLQWGMAVGAAVLVFHYGVTDNIGYSNLEKRYEKTYAYCVRLLDRIEQTEGYYQGIPIAMVGVVGDKSFPLTDITRDVTGGMIGLSGDVLLYTGDNYKAFMKNYLGATLNFLPPEAMSDIYYSPEYKEMDSFPGRNSTRVVDGILYVKTENISDE